MTSWNYRRVGGIDWSQGSSGPFQHLLRLSQQEVLALRKDGRMERVCKIAGHGVHLQLLEQSVQGPRLLITSLQEDAVEVARLAVAQFLDKSSALVIPLHPVDMHALWFRRRTLLEKLEEESGCRIVLEYKSKKDGKDMSWKQDSVHLLGDQAAQSRAVQLLAPCCTQSVLPHGSMVSIIQSERNSPMQSFDQVIRGMNISLSENATVATRTGCKGVAAPLNCIVTGLGYVPSFEQGAFFAMRVRQVDLDRGLRGGTRIGISSVPLSTPIPSTLQKTAGSMWVIGRGESCAPATVEAEVSQLDMSAAYFDNLQVGEEIGIFVTRQHGALVIWRRRSNEENWELLVQWDAHIDNTNGVYAILELSGRLLEVELVQRQPPEDQIALYEQQRQEAVVGVAEEVAGDGGSSALDPAAAPASELADIPAAESVAFNRARRQHVRFSDWPDHD